MKKIRGFNDFIYNHHYHELNALDFINERRRLEKHFIRRGYFFIEMPLVEEKELFARSTGEGTDIIQKEMFDIKERKEGRTWSLRPEATAQVIRLIKENKIDKEPGRLSKKLMYFGPMFRYERPQKGRYRQFYSFGTEIFYKEKEDLRTYYILELLTDLLSISPKDVVLKINILPKRIEEYKKNLKVELTNIKEKLTKTSQENISKNVLRVLDNKIDKKILSKQVTPISKYFNKEENELLKTVKEYLEKTFTIKIEIDNLLVRGLDYYDGFVFELVEKENKYFAIAGGGEYSNILKKFEFSDEWRALGFGIGFERWLLNTKSINTLNEKDLILVDKIGNTKKILELRNKLVSLGYTVTYKKATKNLFKEQDLAIKRGYKYFVFLGEKDEAEKAASIIDLVNKNVLKKIIFN